MSFRRAVLVLLLSLAVTAPGCRQQEQSAPSEEPPRPTIRIGLIPEHNIFAQKKRYQPLADYLSERVGATVVLKVLSRYGNIIDNFVSNDLDGAFFGSFTAALAHRKLGVQALARPEYLDGTSSYHGLIFVRRDSGIKDGNDIKGKRFVFVDKATTAGWLLPLHYFKTQGIKDYGSWLKEAYYSGSHEAAIYDVLERKADVGAAKNTVFYRLARNDRRILDELVILTKSPDVPENGLCVRSDLDAALKSRIEETLLGMTDDKEGRAVLKEFGASRFIPTVESDYNVVFEFAEEVGLDLETYDYMND